ncbi:Protein kinase C-binding protein NELL1 [Fukomys damarensis]|uniref:Protein kinase C-binding protein NELL1 n=1 Tax=Fukomys damarensis TaxID=885580 RepID=A0A091DX37_FUKDA|nr:Protein kinase C-binding protein NELL1 [Fukomys damarensis]
MNPQSAVGFGLDPDLQMDIITELDLVNTTLGVTQVSGLHNGSKAFLFQGIIALLIIPQPYLTIEQIL